MSKVQVKINRSVDVRTTEGVLISKGKSFTKVNPYHKNIQGSQDTGIFGHYTIEELVDFTNGIEQGTDKFSHAFLKGTYRGGTSSAYAIKNSDFLFYDIDIKETENPELFKDQFKRGRLVEELKKYSVFLGRSHSQIGIWGVLNVKGLSRISDTADHNLIGKHIYKYLEKKLNDKGIKISFDIAQAKYRQVRFAAWQREKIQINLEAIPFDFTFIKTEQEIIKGVPDLKFEGMYSVTGSIRDKFNNDNSVESLMPAAGFTHVTGTRWKHELSISSTSGEVKDGQYINNSASFSDRTYFDAFALAAKTLGFTFKQMYRHLKEKGYKADEVLVEDVVKDVKPILSNEEIFKLCYPLKYASLDKKQEFLKEADIPADQLEIYKAYLNMKRIEIAYDETLTIKKWVSEVSPQIFDRADSKRRIIIASETGTGKSTAILDKFRELRPDKRMLFIAPLTAIVDQLMRPEDLDMIALKGGVPETQFNAAFNASIVIATHEQATKMLGYKGFDYIIKDEIHSDIVGSSFKNKVIAALNAKINAYGVPVIGLTGTPLNIFRNKGLDFYLIKIDSNKPANRVIQRTDNRQAVKIILQHQRTVKGKAFYRANSKDSLKAVRKHLIKEGYSSDEILVLDASKEAKGSEDFGVLVSDSMLNENLKVVLTTSVIDEGVSIKNTDFTDIVFIDSDYHPRPEPLKQFLNRFRDAQGVTYYHYRRTPEEQDYRQYTDEYTEASTTLEHQINELDYFRDATYETFISNDKFYYEDKTINYYYLGYKITKDYFSTFNNSEFIEFIEINYNILFVEDRGYEPQEVDVRKPTAKENKALRTELYDTLGEQLINIVMYETADKALQQEHTSVSKEEYDKIPENNKKAVKDNISYFETLLKTRVELGKILEEEYVDRFLRDEAKMLDGKQELGRKVAFLNNQRALEIENPNKADRDIQSKLRRFIDNANAVEGNLTKVLVEQWQRELGSVDISLNVNYKVNDFLAANTDFMYYTKKARYIRKSENPEKISKIVKKWMLPILKDSDQESTREPSQRQLRIPFKN